MTREEEIAVAFYDYRDALKLSTFCDFEYIDVQGAFEEGAEWADSHPVNVWHDATEEPKKGEDIIALDIDGISVSGVYKDYIGKGIYRYHCFLCEWDAVVKWAYISDLLPKGGER